MAVSNLPRIAVFDDWLPVHVRGELVEPATDLVEDWEGFRADPKIKISFFDKERPTVEIVDKRPANETLRVVKFGTCPICRVVMERWTDSMDVILLCPECGYWAGRGHRDWGSHQQPVASRGVISRYTPLRPLDDLQTSYLVSHLRRFPADMNFVSPQRAETFVVDLLKDYLECEVKPLGGVKDGGIDGYILAGESLKTIIQVKWRKDQSKAEAVSVVRELAGTLLVQGAPEGILVSNRYGFSRQAAIEAAKVSSRKEVSLGRISMSLLSYHNILDMLAVSNRKLGSQLAMDEILEWHTKYCVFDGASGLPASMFPGVQPTD